MQILEQWQNVITRISFLKILLLDNFKTKERKNAGDVAFKSER